MSTVAIMQPYFFPYLGYFGLIKNVDRFILFDTVQYIRHGWIDRNRVLKQNGGWLYIRAPLVSHSMHTLIKDIRVDNAQSWQDKLVAQVASYKRVAPHYWAVKGLLQTALAGHHDSIVALNKSLLEAVCTYLGINASFEVFSEMDLEIEQPNAPDEWALNICKALGDVKEYWNPPGGQSFFEPEKYRQAGIHLRFHRQRLPTYDQKRDAFEPGLSIIDILMFNSVEEVRNMLTDFELV